MLPLRRSGLRSASWVPAAYPRLPSPSLHPVARCHFVVGRLWRTLASRLRFSSVRLSHLTMPSADLSHSLAFDSLTLCEASDVLGLHATPVVFRLQQSPLVALPPAPGSPKPSRLPVAGCAFVESSRAEVSARFSPCSPSVCFPLAGVSTIVGGQRHCFRSLRVGVVRPHPQSGCYLCSSKRSSAPRHCRVPLVSLALRLGFA